MLAFTFTKSYHSRAKSRKPPVANPFAQSRGPLPEGPNSDSLESLKNKHKYRRHDERPDETSDANILAYLATLENPASVRQIAHGMALKHRGRRYLPHIMQKLKRRGEVEEPREGCYRLSRKKTATQAAVPSAEVSRQGKDSHSSLAITSDVEPTLQRATANLIKGRLVAHRDGYGFVVPDAPIANVDGDLFIPPQAIGDAMNGDRVLARIESRRPDGRAEGRIVQIAERAHPTVVGLFRYESDGNYVLPYDTRIQQSILIPAGEELPPSMRDEQEITKQAAAARRHRRIPELDGAVVNAQITRYPKGGLTPMGRVIEILGRPGEMGVDVEIMIRKHHLPFEFAEDALAEARRAPRQVSEAASRGRRDFRHLPIVTIDGETARDFDDAVHVSEHANGGYELQVHIADVAHYVQRNASLDREARLRGKSVYFPNRAFPMLPEELSN